MDIGHCRTLFSSCYSISTRASPLGHHPACIYACMLAGWVQSHQRQWHPQRHIMVLFINYKKKKETPTLILTPYILPDPWKSKQNIIQKATNSKVLRFFVDLVTGSCPHAGSVPQHP